MKRISNIEFFTFEEEVWYRTMDGAQYKLIEGDDMVRFLYAHLGDFYPAALSALEERFKRLSGNIRHYQYRIVRSFCKCNFGAIDHVLDVDRNGVMRFEHVPCTQRGDCCLEGVVCHPVFNSQISPAEFRVLALLHRGLPRDQIAEQLFLSPHTVNNHVKNAFQRIGVHSEAEFMNYANTHNLFPGE